MHFNLFSLKNNYHKNGIWWFTKILNRLIGEQKYDSLRVFRRVQSMRFYYARQQVLYELVIDHPDLAQWTGTYPKVDSSHGFPFYASYEMYRDFQENTLNSDGSFAQWITVLVGYYVFHVFVTYMMPYYWTTNPIENGEESRHRMMDAISSTVWEELGGLEWAEWGWLPHDFAYTRNRAYQGYKHPDDIRAVHIAGLNRKNKYCEHYMEKQGEGMGSMNFYLGFIQQDGYK